MVQKFFKLRSVPCPNCPKSPEVEQYFPNCQNCAQFRVFDLADAMDYWAKCFRQVSAIIVLYAVQLKLKHIERINFQTKIGQFENKIRELSDENASLVQTVIQLEEKQSSVDPTLFDCSICFEESVQNRIVFVPCGHTACKNCAEEWEKTCKTCHICRTKIQNRIKLNL